MSSERKEHFALIAWQVIKLVVCLTILGALIAGLIG